MKMPTRTALAALALSLAAAPAAAQESGAYVVRLGRDTVVVEQFTRTADRIEGTLVGHTPRTSIRTYTATLRPDGSISRLEVVTRIPTEPALLPQTLTVTMGSDSAQWRTQRGDTVREGTMAITADATPWVGNAWGLAQPTIRAAQARGADSVALPVVQAGARQTGTISFIRKGADSLLVRAPNGVTRARVDAQGRVLGAHSPESTFKADVERVASLDAGAVAAAWAARDRAGPGIGTLSPRDSVVGRIAGAEVSVAYGRPSMRGRRIAPGAFAPATISRTMRAASSVRGLSSVTMTSSASASAIRPISGRLPRSRSPPQERDPGTAGSGAMGPCSRRNSSTPVIIATCWRHDQSTRLSRCSLRPTRPAHRQHRASR